MSKKEIDLLSQAWTDIVFEGKNKEYGAYKMRRDSSKRHVISFLIAAVVFSLLATIPPLIDFLSKPNYERLPIVNVHRLTNVALDESVTLQEYLQQMEAPPTVTQGSMVIDEEGQHELGEYDIAIETDGSKKKILI